MHESLNDLSTQPPISLGDVVETMTWSGRTVWRSRCDKSCATTSGRPIVGMISVMCMPFPALSVCIRVQDKVAPHVDLSTKSDVLGRVTHGSYVEVGRLAPHVATLVCAAKLRMNG